MWVVVKPRRGGKTTRLIEEMKFYPNSVMICINESEAQRLREENKELREDQFISVEDMRVRLRGRPDQRLFVDNADLILQRLLNHQIYAVSITED